MSRINSGGNPASSESRHLCMHSRHFACLIQWYTPTLRSIGSTLKFKACTTPLLCSMHVIWYSIVIEYNACIVCFKCAYRDSEEPVFLRAVSPSNHISRHVETTRERCGTVQWGETKWESLVSAAFSTTPAWASLSLCWLISLPVYRITSGEKHSNFH